MQKEGGFMKGIKNYWPAAAWRTYDRRYGNSVVCGIQRNLETGKRGLVLL